MRVCFSCAGNGTRIAVTLKSAKVGSAPHTVRVRMPRMGNCRGTRDVFRGGCDHLDPDSLVPSPPLRRRMVGIHQHQTNENGASKHTASQKACGVWLAL